MKLLLDKSLQTVDGKEMFFKNEEQQDEVVKFKKVYLNCLGAMKAVNGEQAIQAWDLGQRIFKAKGDFEVTPEEALLVKKAVSQNQSFSTFIIGQVLSDLKI